LLSLFLNCPDVEQAHILILAHSLKWTLKGDLPVKPRAIHRANAHLLRYYQDRIPDLTTFPTSIGTWAVRFAPQLKFDKNQST
jgi:hypothetical protein